MTHHLSSRPTVCPRCACWYAAGVVPLGERCGDLSHGQVEPCPEYVIDVLEAELEQAQVHQLQTWTTCVERLHLCCLIQRKLLDSWRGIIESRGLTMFSQEFDEWSHMIDQAEETLRLDLVRTKPH